MTEKKNEKFFVSIRTNRIDVSRKDGSFHASILAVYADHRFTDSHHDDRIWKNICNQTPEKDQSHIRVQNGNVYEKQRDVGICTSIFWKMVVYNRVVFVAAFCYLPVICLEQPNPHNRYGWGCDLLDTTFSAYVSCFSDRKKRKQLLDQNGQHKHGKVEFSI